MRDGKAEGTGWDQVIKQFVGHNKGFGFLKNHLKIVRSHWKIFKPRILFVFSEN